MLIRGFQAQIFTVEVANRTLLLFWLRSMNLGFSIPFLWLELMSLWSLYVLDFRSGPIEVQRALSILLYEVLWKE